MKKVSEAELLQVWNKESESYRDDAVGSPDYLAHFEIVRETLESGLGQLSGKTLLDVGSGTGITSAYLASLGMKVTLLDISKKALNFSRQYFKRNKLPVTIVQENAFSMKFAPASFDVVWNGGVIEHFDDTEKAEMIQKMWKLVKPGGMLLISAPNARDYPFMLAKKILELRKKWAFGWEDDLTKERLMELAIQANVKSSHIFSYNPVVGWWFFPYGKEITNLLQLNFKNLHKLKSPWGHNLVFSAKKM